MDSIETIFKYIDDWRERCLKLDVEYQEAGDGDLGRMITLLDRIKELETEIKDHAQWAERMVNDPKSEAYRSLIDQNNALQAKLDALSEVVAELTPEQLHNEIEAEWHRRLEEIDDE